MFQDVCTCSVFHVSASQELELFWYTACKTIDNLASKYHMLDFYGNRLQSQFWE